MMQKNPAMQELLSSPASADAASALPRPAPQTAFLPYEDTSRMQLNRDQAPFVDLMLAIPTGLHY